jgi:hypothetical protein
MELRKAGATYEVIAAELGYADPKSAKKAVEAGLEHTARDVADDLRPLELARLDRMQMGLWEGAINGDVPSVMACLKIADIRAKITGLYAPTKSAVTLDQHSQVDVSGAVMVIKVGGDKADYIAGLKAMRGDAPPAIEGTSRSVGPSGTALDGPRTVADGPPIGLAQLDDEDDQDDA